MHQNYIKYNVETSPKYPQTFNGKERDSETGFSYFGTRYYDSDILTGWLSVDPMSDKYQGLSPYAYCGWNPVKLVDPDGRMMDEPPYNGSGWGHNTRRIIYNTLGISNNINNVFESGINSILQSDDVIVQGQALAKIKKDPAVIGLEKNIIKTVKSNKNYGKNAFSYKDEVGKQLGGKRTPGSMWDQFKDPLNPRYRDTWSVAFDELTWLARSVTIEYDVPVTKEGAIDISYIFSDTFDLRPSKNRSTEYNIACTILVFLHHDVCGGNDKMKVNASWNSSYNAKGKKIK